MTLRERVRALNVEADHLYKRLQRHYETCGCWERLFSKHRLDYRADCIVGVTLRHAWVVLKDTATLPSPDPRMYRDERDDVTTKAAAAEGATT